MILVYMGSTMSWFQYYKKVIFFTADISSKIPATKKVLYKIEKKKNKMIKVEQ